MDGALMFGNARRRAVVALLAGALAVAAGVAIATAVVPPAAGQDTCARNEAGSPSTAFDLPSVAALRDRLPTFGKTPELDAVPGPIQVVAFEGPHQAIPVFPPPDPNRKGPIVFNNVLCVVDAKGIPNYYVDVDMTNLNLEGLTLDRHG